ncbi:helix-turn-helix transcriptional regulator [Treponema sp. OMZ 787]|uniref:winged helix-turn-helix transcriptional regulator n=1 Tax=Treponema sp. OMZ 787 TaxID=2563669 RepID=UPI0020A54C20|nr:winged helix-turn-helix transcriptional regulator [Treponema sp. OMZ 787]UTC63149.1 helix-turn-helix transcriptional regulator [Treponema sp. OMZ 787]
MHTVHRRTRRRGLLGTTSFYGAAVSKIQKIPGGKWKIEILYYIGIEKINCFGQLRRKIGEINESLLTKQLRERKTGCMFTVNAIADNEYLQVFIFVRTYLYHYDRFYGNCSHIYRILLQCITA